MNKLKRVVSIVLSLAIIIVLFLYFLLLPVALMPLVYVPIVIICICILLGKCNFPLVLPTMISYVCICEIDFFVSAIFNLIGFAFSNSILTNAIGLFLIGAIAGVCNKLDVSFYKKVLENKENLFLLKLLCCKD